MIRIGTIVWFVILALLGVGLFQVKYAVQAKERDLRKVNRQIAADRDAMRVLDAEWSYLNDPVRLADLTRRHTDLTPVMASQIATFDSLALRPADAPEAAPALPPIASAPEADVVATPVAAKSVQPTPQSENDPVFSTSSAKADAAPAEEDDATIRAILQDMQAHQDTDAQPEAGQGKTEPANEAGAE
jgi:hypothetical protein